MNKLSQKNKNAGATSPTILQQIIQQKYREISAAQKQVSLTQLESSFPDKSELRPFVTALRQRIEQQLPAVIAEIKKASPSKGLIREDFDPPQIARDYAANGATCLSVLTDEKFFQGKDEYLVAARAACELPVIRKDFIVEPYQIAQARAMGADCVLLIVAALDAGRLKDLSRYAAEIDLDVLVEIHNVDELEVALALQTELIGINNRNLHTFETSLGTSIELAKLVPAETLIITESGINHVADVALMIEHGIFGFLIGETFMRAPSPGKKLKEFFSSYE